MSEPNTHEMDFETFCLLQQERVRQLPCSGGHWGSVNLGRYRKLGKMELSVSTQVEMKNCRLIERRIDIAELVGKDAEDLPVGWGK